MTRDKLIETIESWEWDDPQDDPYKARNPAALADAIVAAGPIVSDEVLAKLKAEYKLREQVLALTLAPSIRSVTEARAEGFRQALELIGLLSAVKEGE